MDKLDQIKQMQLQRTALRHAGNVQYMNDPAYQPSWFATLGQLMDAFLATSTQHTSTSLPSTLPVHAISMAREAAAVPLPTSPPKGTTSPPPPCSNVSDQKGPSTATQHTLWAKTKPVTDQSDPLADAFVPPSLPIAYIQPTLPPLPPLFNLPHAVDVFEPLPRPLPPSLVKAVRTYFEAADAGDPNHTALGDTGLGSAAFEAAFWALAGGLHSSLSVQVFLQIPKLSMVSTCTRTRSIVTLSHRLAALDPHVGP